MDGSITLRPGQRKRLVDVYRRGTDPSLRLRAHLLLLLANGQTMDWRTGKRVVTEGKQRNADLFIAHLDDRRRRYRGYRKIHVIGDNARFHRPERCKKVAQYLEKWGHRIELHFLPKYAPETNPIERVWWHLHDEVTRNHRCFDITELVELATEWLEERAPFPIEGHVYELLDAA